MAQETQPVFPEPEVNLPGSQRSHVKAPIPAKARPALQLEQTDEPTSAV